MSDMRKHSLLLAILWLTSGCATVVHGRYQTVLVQSEPAGASVAFDCGDAPAAGGTTPVRVVLRRSAEHCTATVAKEGFTQQVITFTGVRSHATWGNLGFGFVYGVGAAFALTPLFDTSTLPIEIAAGGIAAGTAVGMGVDKMTGAIYQQIPPAANVRLEKQRPR